jgi:hypothetical protein
MIRKIVRKQIEYFTLSWSNGSQPLGLRIERMARIRICYNWISDCNYGVIRTFTGEFKNIITPRGRERLSSFFGVSNCRDFVVTSS